MKTKPLVMVGCYALLSFTFVGTAAAADTKIEQALGEIIAKSNKPKLSQPTI
jgi:hypothetical protein